MGLVKTLCRLGIFLVCAQTVVHFRPKASYEKYLRLLVGSMVLLQVLAPLLTRRGISWEEEWEAMWDFSEATPYADMIGAYGGVNVQADDTEAAGSMYGQAERTEPGDGTLDAQEGGVGGISEIRIDAIDAVEAIEVEVD